LISQLIKLDRKVWKDYYAPGGLEAVVFFVDLNDPGRFTEVRQELEVKSTIYYLLNSHILSPSSSFIDTDKYAADQSYPHSYFR
jgi:hypothetical protein